MDSDRKLTAEEKQAHEANVLAAKAQGSAEKKVKPALKKKTGFGTTAAAPAGEAAEDHHEKKALKWDEVAITEHDKLRGTRMKIDEPDTPYTHYDSGQESDDSSGKQLQKSPVSQAKNALSWDALQNRLDSVAAVQDAFPGMGTNNSDSTSPTTMNTSNSNDDSQSQLSDGATRDEEKKEMKKLEFAEHRKRHYNEMELVRQYRQQHADDDDDEDDDE